MEKFEAANADRFINSLYFYDKRNLIKTKARRNSHTMLLNFPHNQVCRQSQYGRLIKIENQFTDLNNFIKNFVKTSRTNVINLLATILI